MFFFCKSLTAYQQWSSSHHSFQIAVSFFSLHWLITIFPGKICIVFRNKWTWVTIIESMRCNWINENLSWKISCVWKILNIWFICSILLISILLYSIKLLSVFIETSLYTLESKIFDQWIIHPEMSRIVLMLLWGFVRMNLWLIRWLYILNAYILEYLMVNFSI